MKEYKYKINGENYNVTINEVGQTAAQVEVNGVAYSVEVAQGECESSYISAPPYRAPAETMGEIRCLSVRNIP